MNLLDMNGGGLDIIYMEQLTSLLGTIELHLSKIYMCIG